MGVREPVNWRAFGAKMAAVVLGILIALALDRTVRWFDIQGDVREARAAMDAELAENRGRVAAWLVEDPCTERRLADLETWTAAAPVGQRLGRLERPNLWALKSSAWEVAKAGQAALNIPLKNQLLYASLYDALANEGRIVQSERDAWVQIASFGGAATDADERRLMRRPLGVARELLRSRRINYAYIFDRMDRLHIKSTSPTVLGGHATQALCAPLPVG